MNNLKLFIIHYSLFIIMSDKKINIGDKVKIIALPSYIKTADPSPMLRPPNVIEIGAEGIVMDHRPGGYWGIRFSKGAFLIESQYFEVVSTAKENPQ